ncbi:MAG TPA: hypothetical protein VGF94_18770 [Kofleriaceae bacterium]|jgi:hypothetical protein
MKSWYGYLFGGFLVLFAFTLFWIALSSATSTMEGMQRVAMPGTAEVALPAGPSTLYLETKSKIGDRVIDSGDGAFDVHCRLAGLELDKPASHVSYSLAGYSGHNLFAVVVDAGGKYQLTCESDGGKPFAIAIGAGVGAWIVIAVLAVLPLLGGLALLIVTFVRRRRRGGGASAASAR